MSAERGRFGLGKRLLAVLLAAVIAPSLVIAAILIGSRQAVVRQEAFGLMQVAAETIAEDVRQFVSGAEAILVGAAVSHGFPEMQEQMQLSTLRNLFGEFEYFRRLSVRGPTGEVVSLIRGREVEWKPPPDLVRAGFDTAAQGRTYLSPVYYADRGQALVLMMLPIVGPDRKPVGVIAGVVSLNPVSSIVERKRLGSEGYGFVVDSKGRVIAHPRLGTASIGESLADIRPVRKVVAGEPDAGFEPDDVYVDRLHHKVVAVHRRIPGLGWGVIVQQPERAVFRPPFTRIASVLLWTLAFALFFGLLGLYLVRRVTRPILGLRQGARIIGSGDLKHRIVVRTGDEMEDLADSFNQMAASLDSSRSRLEAEHDKAVRAARTVRTLFRMSQALVLTLNLEERLSVTARNISDVCGTDKTAIWLIEENRLVPSKSHGLSPAEEDVFHSRRVHLDEVAPVTRQAIAEKRPIVVRDAATDKRVPRDLAERFGMRSLLVLPFLFDGQTIGYAITYEAGKVRRFTNYQISLAGAVAIQAAVAIQNARTYERERRISETLQRSLLPQVPSTVDSFEIADLYLAALAEAEIGGDFYDLVELSPTQFGLVIADVSGKGLSAAIYTAMVKYIVRAYAMEDPTPTGLVRRLNEAVYRYTSEQMFVTLFYGVLDTEARDLTYVNAGHEQPMLFGEDRRVCTRLATTGTALGIVQHYEFGSERIEFIPGDALLMYTDGATDVRRDGEFLGADRLEDLFCTMARTGARAIVDELGRSIREYAANVLRDDVALLVVKYRRDET